MKTLPDHPNLDHLRQQAKDLLAGLRDIRPATSLADAQASLAEQYGFRTWTELKAEVDRRRGGDDVADPRLAREIAARYGLGEVIGEMRSVAADDSGRRWSLRTGRGRWSVRTLDTWWPVVDVETEVTLREAAAKAGIRVPAAVRSRAGAILESVDGHTWRVCRWHHSGPPLAAPVSATVAHRVGEILGTLHRLRLPVDRVSPWHAGPLSTVEWSRRAAAAEAAGLDWAGALREAIPTLAGLDAVGAAPPTGRPVLTHNTLGPACVRRTADGDLVILHWEHAGGQPPEWEVADALVHWTVNPDGEVNTVAARAMLDGYRSVADLPDPLDLTMFSGAATSLGNYAAEVLDGALAAGSEGRRDAARGVHHLLAHLPSRATFERLLAAVRPRQG